MQNESGILYRTNQKLTISHTKYNADRIEIIEYEKMYRTNQKLTIQILLRNTISVYIFER